MDNLSTYTIGRNNEQETEIEGENHYVTVAQHLLNYFEIQSNIHYIKYRNKKRKENWERDAKTEGCH